MSKQQMKTDGHKWVLALGAVLLVLWGCGSAEQAKQAPPNFLIVLTDDQGWGDLSVHGNTNLATPQVDSLARDGALFERFFVSPVCSPTRAEFLTGRYHVRGGVQGTSAGSERLDLDEHTIAETFQAAGYKTGAFGKWHNGGQHPYHPNARGFDEYYGFTSGHWAHYFDTAMDHNGEPVRGSGFIIDDLTDHAMAFMEENRDQPFFAYVPYNTPHSPMQVPDRFYEKFDGAELEMHNREPEREDLVHIRAALAMCENIDWNVGRMLAKLDELGLAENTVVLYFADNGPNGWRWNGDMKGRKGSADEGGVRSPLLMRWPGHIKAGLKVPQIAAAIDLLPTLADLAGIPVLAEKPLDGKSLKPLLAGGVAEWPERTLFSYWRGRATVRTQQYRLDLKGQLFDIPADPGQRTDVAGEHPDLAARLKADLDGFVAEAVAELGGEEQRPFTVGHSQVTLLPARDGVTAGPAVKRSNRFPNSSYFLDWKSEDDRITWDIEVGEAGDYEAVVYYACPQADVGSTVELSFLDASVAAKVTEAHDPPLIGPADDRSPRTESPTKDFQPMSLGVISLAKDRGKLTLRATDIAGGQVMEVHSIKLTKK
jgi:arylsulfatase A-like enzyme